MHKSFSNIFLTVLLVFVSLTVFAQPGTTIDLDKDKPKQYENALSNGRSPSGNQYIIKYRNCLVDNFRQFADSSLCVDVRAMARILPHLFFERPISNLREREPAECVAGDLASSAEFWRRRRTSLRC